MKAMKFFVASAVVLTANFANAAKVPVVIDFENLPGETVVTNQYANLGVIFSSPPSNNTPKIGYASGASTTGNVLQDYSRTPLSAKEPFQIIAEFSGGTSYVNFTAYVSEGYSLTMNGYDADGELLGSVTSDVSPYFGYHSTVSLSDVGEISKVVWQSSEPFIASAIIDNLAFEAEVPVPAAAWLFGSAILGLVATKVRS